MMTNGVMKLSITTHGLIVYLATLSMLCVDILIIAILSIVMMIDAIALHYAECRNARYHYAKSQ